MVWPQEFCKKNSLLEQNNHVWTTRSVFWFWEIWLQKHNHLQFQRRAILVYLGFSVGFIAATCIIKMHIPYKWINSYRLVCLFLLWCVGLLLAVFPYTFTVPKGRTSELPLADSSAFQQIFQLAKCSLYAANTVWIYLFIFTAASWDPPNNKIFHPGIIHRLFAWTLYLSIINLNCKIP